MADARPLFITVILGTARQGRSVIVELTGISDEDAGLKRRAARGISSAVSAPPFQPRGISPHRRIRTASPEPRHQNRGIRTA